MTNSWSYLWPPPQVKLEDVWAVFLHCLSQQTASPLRASLHCPAWKDMHCALGFLPQQCPGSQAQSVYILPPAIMEPPGVSLKANLTTCNFQTCPGLGSGASRAPCASAVAKAWKQRCQGTPTRSEVMKNAAKLASEARKSHEDLQLAFQGSCYFNFLLQRVDFFYATTRFPSELENAIPTYCKVI